MNRSARRRLVGKTTVMVACILALGACVAQDAGSDPPPDGAVRIAGRLTDEGVECQAMRGTDGKLYTLVGEIGDFEAGDRVEVEATPVAFSFCMQGETLNVLTIRQGDQ